MRVALLTILLVGAPFVFAETKPEPPSDDAVKPKVEVGPLSPLEEKLQGTWKPGYTIVIDGREFCADTQPGQWYEGYIVIRTDEEPAQFDFVIEACGCDFEGQASAGIFHLDGDAVVVVSAVPGSPRPQVFESNDKLVKMRFQGDGGSQAPGEHCSTWSATDR